MYHGDKPRVTIELDGPDLPKGVTIKAGSKVRLAVVGRITSFDAGKEEEKPPKGKNRDSVPCSLGRPARIEIEYDLKSLKLGSAQTTVEEDEDDLEGVEL